MVAEGGGLVLTHNECLDARGRWAEVFGREAPLWLEVGPGNGFFLTEMAGRHPARNIVALELRYKRVWMCARKLQQAGRTTARVGHFHAGFLAHVFAPGSLAGVWIHHPDPWPKDRHHKNRLLNPSFAAIVRVLMSAGAPLELRSDHAQYADLARELLQPEGFVEEAFSADLDRHHASWPDHCPTNYERKKARAGIPVFGQRWRAPGWTNGGIQQG
jgi:tRNA (guanine-N7-)-methyltransferase